MAYRSSRNATVVGGLCGRPADISFDKGSRTSGRTESRIHCTHCGPGANSDDRVATAVSPVEISHGAGAQSAPVTYEKGKQFLGRGVGGGPAPLSPDQGIEAIDAKTGNIVWKFPMVRVGLSSGLVGTAGGFIFAASAEGQLLALDEKTGKPLWHFRVNGPVNSSPMTYMAGGRQFIAITAATQLLTFGLPD